jgi:predicted SprT family Zn-dependent metalloprotease
LLALRKPARIQHMQAHHIPQLLEQAKAAQVIIWARFQSLYPKLRKFQSPTIIINNRFKTCGGVCKADERVIEYSAEMYFYNQEEYYKNIMPHENAHQVEWDLLGTSGHGPAWKEIMRAYGCEPSRLHNMVNPMQVKRIQARNKK